MAIKTSQGREAAYTRYKNAKTWETNRRRRLNRALKRNPENEQIALALKSIVYRRSTPLQKQWGSTRRQTARLFKKFCGRFDLGYFNEKTNHQAVFEKMRLQGYKVPAMDRGSMFSLGLRAVTREVN